MPPQPPPTPAPRSPLLLRSQQLAVGVLVLAGLVSLGGYWAWRGMIRGRLIEIDHSSPLTAQFQLDVNSAEWPELTQMPGIGEGIARRIVDERVAHGPFADHEDLQRRVRGIGPRTLEKIRPYLLPLPEVRNVADRKPATAETGG
ncbi:MAG: helix-hairpin-helix domain-containing protein [Planctomycetia bacterium]|nr:helix-hairpin-helix domain-containing protein [Planctomycetia bacterium]